MALFWVIPIIRMKTNSSWICGGAVALLSLSSGLAVETPDYKVDRSFGQGELNGGLKSIAMDEKDQLYVLLGGGKVQIFDQAGKATGSFKSEMTPAPGAMALAGGKVYLLATETKQVERESQGRKMTIAQPSGVKCGVFSPTGTKESEFALPVVVSANDAHFVGEQLAIADLQSAQIVLFELNGDKPKVAKKIDKVFRLCCGIFDFCPTTDGKSLLVANLGAFKVQTFTRGSKTAEFGARGDKLDEFHGCCNPVNVADLGDDIIITVEKDPTRVKISSRKGKKPKSIEGLGELVTGCSTNPIAVDSKGTLYLASATKGCIVRCVSDTPRSALSTPGGAAAAEKSGPAELSELREWQNASGRKLQGKLVSFEDQPDGAKAPTLVRDGKVRLLVGTKTYALPVNSLVEGDQEFVKKLGADLAGKAE